MNHMERKRQRARLLQRLGALYDRMDAAYAQAALAIPPDGFSCQGCAQNCCVSHFQHHTLVEWAYFFKGLEAIDPAAQDRYRQLAQDNVLAARQILALGETPEVMCPMNEGGLCAIYQHRFMICRMHGVGHRLVPPGKGELFFPGCPRFEILNQAAAMEGPPLLDRTPFYQELAAIEAAYRQTLPSPRPKVDLTLSEMLLLGPPA